MRLILVPLNKTNSLLYGQRTLVPKVRKTPRLDEKIIQRATKTWHGFEQSETKWKKSLVSTTNKLLAGIPYSEWSLRTIPSMNTLKRALKDSEGHISPKEIQDYSDVEPVPLVFPHNVMTMEQALSSLEQLSSRGLKYHRKMCWRIAIGIPFTAPFAAVPVIPNIPFFYLAFRLYCHWEAYQGAKHLRHLLDKKQFRAEQLPAYDVTFEGCGEDGEGPAEGLYVGEREKERIRRIFALPKLDDEVQRAVGQVERQAERDEKAEREKSDSASPEPASNEKDRRD